MTNRSLLTFAIALASAQAAFAQFAGPSSSATSYLTPTASGWSSTALLTVGDSVGGYKMVGIPDGLGAYDNGNGSITVLMNHELGTTSGITRAHGSAGAFVSQWTIDKNTLQVTAGRDLIQSGSSVFGWNGATDSWVAGTQTFNRLCSADLPATSAFLNTATGLGYAGRIFMNGEEAGNEGRAWGFVSTGAEAGTVYELPKLGRLSWENSLANPYSGNKTVVIGTDDTTPGQVYVYIGDKQSIGNAVEKAGLNNGSLYGIKVTDAGTNYGNTATARENAGAINGSFQLQAVVAKDTGDTPTPGGALQTDSTAAKVTEFARPEDGQWIDADTFVFVTTGASVDGQTQTAKLYRLDFSNPNDFTTGGTISLVLDSASLIGTDGQTARSFDNLTVGVDGKIYIQEDPGNNAYIAKIWQVDLANPTAAKQIFESDRNRFGTSPLSPFTQDEEHSGIIDVTWLFNGTEGPAASWYDGSKVFLADTQAHYSIAGELVEGGQLSLLRSAAVPEPTTYAATASLGLLALAAWKRRRTFCSKTA